MGMRRGGEKVAGLLHVCSPIRTILNASRRNNRRRGVRLYREAARRGPSLRAEALPSAKRPHKPPTDGICMRSVLMTPNTSSLRGDAKFTVESRVVSFHVQLTNKDQVQRSRK